MPTRIEKMILEYYDGWYNAVYDELDKEFEYLYRWENPLPEKDDTLVEDDLDG